MISLVSNFNFSGSVSDSFNSFTSKIKVWGDMIKNFLPEPLLPVFGVFIAVSVIYLILGRNDD